MSKIEKLQQEIEKAKENLLNKFKFEKGDIVEWTKTDKVMRGTITFMYINDKMELSVTVEGNKSYMPTWSGNKHYFTNPTSKDFKKIDNPFNEELHSELISKIGDIDREMLQLTKTLKAQKDKIQENITANMKNCVHKFIQGDEPIRMQKDSFCGDKEVYEFYCERCGMEIESI